MYEIREEVSQLEKNLRWKLVSRAVLQICHKKRAEAEADSVTHIADDTARRGGTVYRQTDSWRRVTSRRNCYRRTPPRLSAGSIVADTVRSNGPPLARTRTDRGAHRVASVVDEKKMSGTHPYYCFSSSFFFMSKITLSSQSRKVLFSRV